MISIVILTHNRLESLKRCIESVVSNTTAPYEIVVVNNGSTDGTREYMYEKSGELLDTCGFKIVDNESNEGVVARNAGFHVSSGEYICQCDDDVVVLPNWDKSVLLYMSDPLVGMVGPQGGLIEPSADCWLNLSVYKHKDSYVDFLTGFFMMMRNVGIFYNPKFGKFWHEELHLSLQYKQAGYRIRMLTSPVCIHASQRTEPIDWDLHNRNKDYVHDEWKDNLGVLRLGGG